MSNEPYERPALTRAVVSVGQNEGDLRGHDHCVLQAAVDYVANLGGGTVQVGPGTYRMRNALHLRSGVHLKGTPGETILASTGGAEVRLAADGDCNDRFVVLESAEDFEIGDGVLITDKKKGGFADTSATLLGRVASDPSGRTFHISAPLYLDYMTGNEATIRRTFSIINGAHVEDVRVEGFVLDGCRDSMPPMNGCRGGGYYLFESQRVELAHCEIRNYPGDGVSFQLSHDIVVENCRVEYNAALGLHPGSGSQRPVVRENLSQNNGSDGMFVCWRVKNGLFENNELLDNGGHGISIGHKDTDNMFRENVILRNSKAGVFFRKETEPQGAHRNTFENNEILDNGLGGEFPAAVEVRGHTHGLVFHNNTIGRSAPDGPQTTAFLLGPNVKSFSQNNNDLRHIETETAQAKDE